MKPWKTCAIVAALLFVVLGVSHADAGLFGCCAKDRCPPPPEVEVLLPVYVRDYTDFYSSIEHATNVGKMFIN